MTDVMPEQQAVDLDELVGDMPAGAGFARSGVTEDESRPIVELPGGAVSGPPGWAASAASSRAPVSRPANRVAR